MSGSIMFSGRHLLVGVVLIVLCGEISLVCSGQELLDVWPALAPGETDASPGEILPFRAEESPRVTRISGIRRPTITVHLAERPDGRSVLILPGGGFRRVVTDKEGTEVAAWLNSLGISAFVLRYRTTDGAEPDPWRRPLQDAQRAMALIRSRAVAWKLNADRIGVAGFSAGGQLAARLLCDRGHLHYEPIDQIDSQKHSPSFALLIYPWNLYDEKTDRLIPEADVPSGCPPVFLVHTHDDKASSLSAVMFYAGLKKRDIPAELHIYQTGGHGYGLRQVPGSGISTWTDHAGRWLNGLSESSPGQQRP
ncbi:MAG: alpha/beta hydrolase [Planctomycetia bacterium]